MKRREELDKMLDLSEEELRAESARLKESLFRLKFKLALGEVDAVKRIREEKRSLARLQTISRQREQAASK
jgi:large subunit ribosomal protein L29